MTKYFSGEFHFLSVIYYYTYYWIASSITVFHSHYHQFITVVSESSQMKGFSKLNRIDRTFLGFSDIYWINS